MAGIARLAQVGLVFRRGAPPRASYVFKHALVQDTAYASLLKACSQKIHATIARVLEKRFFALVEHEPELVAHRLARAGFTEQAIDYWRKAAKSAASRSAMQEAYNHLGAALEAQQALLSKRQRTDA